MSHWYWANFLTSYLWLEPIFLGPDSISMTGPLLGIYLGPGSRVRIQVPKYGFWKKKSLTFLEFKKNILFFNIYL